MRKRISGYINGSVRSVYLASVLNGLIDGLLDVAYWLSSRRRMDDSHKLPTENQARRLLNQTSPKPHAERAPKSVQPDEGIDVTVIVPVYNMEEFVGRCLESLQKQEGNVTYEVIVIDDGSTDKSEAIVDAYHFDNRFRIVHQQNQGFSGARNTGLELARGRYICFVDSDDYVTQNYLQVMMSAAEKTDADIVQVGYFKLYRDGRRRDVLHPSVVLHDEEVRKALRYPGFFWGKLFRRELFAQLRLPEGYWYEDTIVHFLLLRLCRVFVYLPKPLYSYRINEKGITKSSVGNPKALDAYWIVEYCLATSERLGLPRDKTLYELLLYHCGFVLWSRVRALPDAIQRAAFVLASKLVEDNRVVAHNRLPYLYREVEGALLKRNFAKWRLAAKYM